MGLTHSSLLVLKAFLSQPRTPLAGADVLRLTRVQSGTLYPILLRLERQEILVSEWEVGTPEALGRPRRRFYLLTPHGAAFARNALADVGVPVADLSPAIAMGRSS